MKKQHLLILVLLIVGVFAVNTSANAHNKSKQLLSSEQKIFFGDTKNMGLGVATSWVTVNKKMIPTNIGISFNEDALNNLPVHEMQGEYTFNLPSIPNMPFTHIVINWNPMGHEPPGIYDVPHFDFHFYLLTQKEREQITGVGEDELKMYKTPPANYIAKGYVDTHMGHPQMGNHWVDMSSPEFHGNPFTSTFVYGFYDGRPAFYEPMITRAFLLTHTNLNKRFPTPLSHEVKGYYPHSYQINYDERNHIYQIMLTEIKMSE
ncbi:MAG: DUF5602 domain-containing protein [Oligoflexia bacterium]|nr:DUF5602 domain-containing protein [Oligoflexia bacterium]